jgi:hypothetical protein
MKKMPRWLLVVAVGFAASLGHVARADVTNASATNVQQGDNSSDTTQHGNSKSGDAVAGQVAGVVSSGRTSVDATNKSSDVSVETGKASASNHASTFTGLTAGSSTALVGDVFNLGAAANVHEGDNSNTLDQSATATSGDGVGGEVIGVVTSAGGSADVVAANTSNDVKIDTGDATARNDAASFVGLNATGTVGVADIANASATNVLQGDNEADVKQSATSKSGDGVGGQVLGIVSAGAAKVDATNSSNDVKIDTGKSSSANNSALFVGLTDGSSTALTSDIANGAAANVQEGDNSKSLTQTADSASGDGVAGQVAGVVTSAGGSADLVLANTSTDSKVNSGKSDFTNTDNSFTGLNASGIITVL